MPQTGLHAFLRDTRGAGTIEFVLWVPVAAFLLMAVVDATVLFLHHTEMWNVSRDVARRISVGELTEADAKATIEEALFLYSDAYFVQTSNPKSLDVHIYIQTQVRDASIIGIYQPVLDEQLDALVVMRREPV